tara:strand:- start:5842 stop:6273 length:432 start_codon:yes stop_codon:yes gene_type:complete
MTKIKPQYIELDDFYKVARDLSDKYVDLFGTIDIDRIKAFAVINKAKQDSTTSWWSIIQVRDPLCDIFNVDYVFKLFLSDWEYLLEKNRCLLVADALLSIDPANERVKKFDVQDHSLMIRNFGLDYLESDDTPDILSDTFEWK